VNIDDIVQKIELPEEPLAVIFKMQKELMVKYDGIERDNGFQVPEPPYNLDDSKVQARIKDMFWRATEELSEALETLPPLFQLSKWTEFWNTETSIRHFFEELSDALHFLVEASIIANFQELNILFNKLPVIKTSLGDTQPVEKHMAQVIFKMGSAANVFKNKPWKVTQMPTDIGQFRIKLFAVWLAFINLWKDLGCGQKQVYVLYCKKHIINKWRQKTNY